jgi:threonine dehydratase
MVCQVAKLRAQGGNVVQFGQDCVDAERQARAVAQQQGSTYISPYNDWHIMAGGAGCYCQSENSTACYDSMTVDII